MWIKIDNKQNKPTFIGACYVKPFTKVNEENITATFDELIESYTELNKKGNVSMCGDFNARLGDMSGDSMTNTNGTTAKSMMEFLQLENMNVIKQYGIPTFWDVKQGKKK